MRNIPASIVAELSKDRFKSGHIVDITFTNGSATNTYYLSDLSQSITYNAQNYSPSGNLLGIGSPSESSDVRVGEISITLSAVNQAFLTMFLNANQIGQPVVISRVYIDDNGVLIGGFPIYSGNISTYALSESDNRSVVQVSVSSHWADFERVAGRRTNNNDQHRYFPSDDGFEFASSTVKDIKWGRE